MAALFPGLFASLVTNSTKEVPSVLRDTFHTGISLFALGCQCTMNFWACESGQLPAGDPTRGELQRMLGPWRSPEEDLALALVIVVR